MLFWYFTLKILCTWSAIDSASNPAFLYILSGLACSINLSGRTIDKNLDKPPNSWLSEIYFETWEPKPPMTPSSTLTSKECFVYKFSTRTLSRGLQNLASATVVLSPLFSSNSEAFMHSCNLAPKDNMAIVFPFKINLPFPISRALTF